MRKVCSILIIVLMSLFVGGCNLGAVLKNEINNLDQVEVNVTINNDILKKEYEDMIREISEVLYPFYDKVSKRFGYIDNNGKVIIEPIFTNAYDFEDGYALVEAESKIGYINNKGTFKIALTDPELIGLSPSKKKLMDIYNIDKMIIVYKNDKYGVIDNKGNYIVEPVYDEICKFEKPRISLFNKFISPDKDIYEKNRIFINNICVARKGDKYFLLSKEGERLSKFEYDSIFLEDKVITAYNKNKGMLVINQKGEPVSEYFQNISNYKSTASTVPDFIFAQDGKKVSIIDKDGNILTGKTHDSVKAYLYNNESKIFVVMNDGAMEAINEKGNILIKFDREYSEVLVLDKNLYLLLDSNKEGKYVNRKGEFIKDYKAIL